MFIVGEMEVQHRYSAFNVEGRRVKTKLEIDSVPIIFGDLELTESVECGNISRKSCLMDGSKRILSNRAQNLDFKILFCLRKHPDLFRIRSETLIEGYWRIGNPYPSIWHEDDKIYIDVAFLDSEKVTMYRQARRETIEDFIDRKYGIIDV